MSRVTPIRLRLSRAKGFNLQALSRAANGLDAVNCARPSRFGNLYRVGFVACSCRSAGECSHNSFRCEDATDAVMAFVAQRDDCERVNPDRAREYYGELRGRNLACWCGAGECCHVDVLLDRANSARWA